MLHTLYNWTLEKAEHRNALWILGLISFAESSFFPIPPDVLLIPMVLAAPSRAWKIVWVCSISSLLGGIFGYMIGFYFFDLVGQPIFEFYHAMEQFNRFKNYYNEWGATIVAVAGFSPIPYKVFTIASGVTGLSLPTFIIASALSRTARFFLVAWLLKKYGTPIRSFIEKRLGLLSIIFCISLVAGFIVIKYIF